MPSGEESIYLKSDFRLFTFLTLAFDPERRASKECLVLVSR